LYNLYYRIGLYKELDKYSRINWKEHTMLIPKFWERANYAGQDRVGRHIAFNVWGWSNESAADAKNQSNPACKAGI
jgi:hypothetical protein